MDHETLNSGSRDVKFWPRKCQDLVEEIKKTINEPKQTKYDFDG